MGKTTKVNKDMSLANNLILENDLSVLSVRLYTDINGILFILGLTLFISLVNSFLVLSYYWVGKTSVLNENGKLVAEVSAIAVKPSASASRAPHQFYLSR